MFRISSSIDRAWRARQLGRSVSVPGTFWRRSSTPEIIYVDDGDGGFRSGHPLQDRVRGSLPSPSAPRCCPGSVEICVLSVTAGLVASTVGIHTQILTVVYVLFLPPRSEWRGVVGCQSYQLISGRLVQSVNGDLHPQQRCCFSARLIALGTVPRFSPMTAALARWTRGK